jgi:hypothetical protein
MTLYLWDASHYDGHLTRAIMARAKAEGIVAFTHKVGEGTGGDDPEDMTALAAARDAGIEFIGGYHVIRSGPIAPQVDAFLALLDRDEPWWRDFPGFFIQVDLERWPYDPVPAATGIGFGQLARQRARKVAVVYASHGQYGDQLRGWDGPLWNADYVSGPARGFAAMYPGDTWVPQHGPWRGGWEPYSGQRPAFLQYTSSATIAGLTTCDASAFRGSLEQLRALLTGRQTEGDDMATAADIWGAGFGKVPNRKTAGQLLAETHGYARAAAAGAGLDDTELAKIEAAARAGILGSVDDLVAAVVAKLPDTALTKDDVEAAVREVFADAAS